MHGPGLPNSGDAAMPAFQELFMQSRVQHIPSKDAQHPRPFIASAAEARETYVALTRHRHDVRIVVESDRLDAACRARHEDPKMAPTRSAMLEILFKEAHRYREKKNVVDHVADRIRFIQTGSIELPKSRGRFNIAAAVDATRRIELAAQFVGVRSRAFTVQLRQLAKSVLPDQAMRESMKDLISKVWSWTRTPAVSHSRQKSPAQEVTMRNR